ncbi:MAG: DUF2155 domain-containing protein [Pseudomonadota bacterium]
MYKIIFLIIFACFFANAEETLNDEDNFIHEKNYSTIQILNKITAKTKYIDIPVKSSIAYGTLKITVNSCWKSSPYDLAENKILLEIDEKKVGESEYNSIFKGWMLSSSPGISSLEHAVYDIVAINCFDK